MEIKSLELYSQDIKRLKGFYEETLGLKTDQYHADSFSIGFQKTIITFYQKDDATPYHFAINIPSNQEEEALVWLKERLNILKYENDEIIDFSAWNAKSMYFYDTDKNIVEFIARKNLPNDSAEPFGPGSLIEVSEIGLFTDDIPRIYQQLNDNYNLQLFDGGMKSFCAIGDDRGLFIVIDKNKNTWFPVDDQAYPSPFTIEIFSDNGLSKMSYNGLENKITAL